MSRRSILWFCVSYFDFSKWQILIFAEKFSSVKMNGEIPSVPITTLAGISSLTDCEHYFSLPPIYNNWIVVCLVLPEMPLPTPLPQTMSNKSLLFHPRVAEEAQILLSLKDDNLVPQLIQSLIETSADHMWEFLSFEERGRDPKWHKKMTPVSS